MLLYGFKDVSNQFLTNLTDIINDENAEADELSNFIINNWDEKLVFGIPQGYEIKIVLNCESNLFSLSRQENSYPIFEVNKDLFFKVEGGVLMISEDLDVWKSSLDFFEGDVKLNIKGSSKIQEAQIELVLNKK